MSANGANFGASDQRFRRCAAPRPWPCPCRTRRSPIAARSACARQRPVQRIGTARSMAQHATGRSRAADTRFATVFVRRYGAWQSLGPDRLRRLRDCKRGVAAVRGNLFDLDGHGRGTCDHLVHRHRPFARRRLAQQHRVPGSRLWSRTLISDSGASGSSLSSTSSVGRRFEERHVQAGCCAVRDSAG